ncbi:hypothetical protein [Aliarcobacter butzleri]|uniref:hypothetical protein n=1 Tax=Aliarcobacter butzleri TaxID=28197 RepID=UPI0015873615|nr:hypothetical protein [Aliarcobacter butzleri]NUW28951.1 hypothetical protein [Aliarcobacter butzleri]
MEEKVQKAFKNLAVYTIKATQKAILEIEKSIYDKANISVKEHLEQRKKELDRDIDIIRKYLEE